MAVVNEAFAQQFFPDEDPLGKLFGRGSSGIATGEFEIVGVVSDNGGCGADAQG
jgi:hypothetical protein